MPVFFYIDPDVVEDFNMRNVKTVTLNYTFFSKLWVPGVSWCECGAPRWLTVRRGEIRRQRKVQGPRVGARAGAYPCVCGCAGAGICVCVVVGGWPGWAACIDEIVLLGHQITPLSSTHKRGDYVECNDTIRTTHLCIS